MLWNILKVNVTDAGLLSHHCNLHSHLFLAVCFPSALSADHLSCLQMLDIKTSNLVLFSLLHYSEVVSWPSSSKAGHEQLISFLLSPCPFSCKSGCCLFPSSARLWAKSPRLLHSAFCRNLVCCSSSSILFFNHLWRFFEYKTKIVSWFWIDVFCLKQLLEVKQKRII